MLEGIQVYIVCIKANFVTTSNMVLYMANYKNYSTDVFNQS